MPRGYGGGMVYTAKAHDVVKGEADQHGTVILVDRLWPRGIAKADLDLDEWFKDVAPSSQLRKWWGHDPDTFDEFGKRYRAELDERLDGDSGAELNQLLDLAQAGDVTLVFAAKDREVNHAQVLKTWVEDRLG